MTDREQIEDLYREYWECMIRKDIPGFRARMAEDYVLEHMTGVRQSAEAFLQGLKKGTFNYYSAEHDSIQVLVKGEQAVLIGKSRVQAAVYGGGARLWRLRGDFALRKEQGVWKLTGSKASTY